MIKRLLNWLKLWSRKRTYRKAVKEADKEHARTGAKVFVVLHKGEFVALTKRKLKQLRRAKAISNDMVKLAEKIAVYTAK